MRVLALLLLAAGAAASRVFYYNHVTGQSTWERPAAMPLVDADDAPYWVVDGEVTRSPPLEYAWTRGAEGDTPYWYNEVTHESVWQQPAATAWTARSVENHYYVNHVTGEVQRERPAVLGHLDEERNATYYVGENNETTWEVPEAAAWEEVIDQDTMLPYYHNKRTSEVTWTAPPDSNVAWSRWHDELEGL